MGPWQPIWPISLDSSRQYHQRAGGPSGIRPAGRNDTQQGEAVLQQRSYAAALAKGVRHPAHPRDGERASVEREGGRGKGEGGEENERERAV